MIVVVFQVAMREGRAQDYFDLAAELRAEVEQIDGFISVERFESLGDARQVRFGVVLAR